MAGFGIITSHVTSDTAPKGIQEWVGDDKFYMRAMDQDDEAAYLAAALPRVQVYRVPFNVNQFDGTTGDLYSKQKDFLYEIVGLGYKLLWDLHDGLAQDFTDDERKTAWPHLYPDVSNWGDAEYDAYMRPGGTLETTRILPAFTALLDWLDANPTIDAATIGFEAINEPESYDKFKSAVGNDVDRAVGHYGQTCLNIYNLLAARRTGFYYLVGGWDYSRNFDLFSIPSTHLGNKSIVDALRDTVYGSGNTLGWAVHLYPDWVAVQKDPAGVASYLDKELANVWGDPVFITESNHNGGWVNWDDLNTFYRSHFMFAQIGPWLRERGVSFTYWPVNNYAAARLLQITPTDLTLYNQTSFWAFLSNVSMADRHGHFWTGTQHGMLSADVIDSPELTIHLRNHNHEIDALDPEAGSTEDPIGSYAVCFGGGGYKVITGDANSNNFLFGGEGYSAIYGGPNDDFITLGHGGGVVKTGAGTSYVQNCGQGTVYLQGDYSLLLTFWGETDIIIENMSGEHVIHGFDPSKDRIGFNGAFQTASELLAATSLVNANTSEAITGEFDTVIDLPSGGRVVLLLATVSETIDQVCLDFLGWTAPDDYDASKFDPSITPYQTIPAITLPSPDGGGPVTIDGLPTTVRLSDGTEVTLRNFME